MPIDWTDMVFAEALRYLRSLKPTPRDTFDSMSAEAKSHAFTVAHLAKMEALQSVLDALEQAQTDGMTLGEFIKANDSLGLTPSHLENIYRTNTQSAFGRGRWDQLTDPMLSKGLWGYYYRTVGDDRVRETHAVLDGLPFATNSHPEIFPPWGFQCRCSTEPITRRQAERDGLESSDLPGEVQDELGATDFASPALGARFSPDLSGYDLGLVSQFVNDQGRADA